MVIGIDTVRFHKSFHPEIVKELIRPKLGRDKNGHQWFHGLLTFTNKPDTNRFSFQVSFSKLLHGNNLISATPEIIREGIHPILQEYYPLIGTIRKDAKQVLLRQTIQNLGINFSTV